jgi:hypothetical protein
MYSREMEILDTLAYLIFQVHEYKYIRIKYYVKRILKGKSAGVYYIALY